MPAANKTYYRVVAVDEQGKRSGPSDYATGPRPVIYSKPVAAAKVGAEYRYQVGANRSLGDLSARMKGGKQVSGYFDIEKPKFALAARAGLAQDRRGHGRALRHAGRGGQGGSGGHRHPGPGSAEARRKGAHLGQRKGALHGNSSRSALPLRSSSLRFGKASRTMTDRVLIFGKLLPDDVPGPWLGQSTMIFVIFLAASVSWSAEKQAPPAASRGPNILFIMTDEQRWDCVGANGNPLIKTPSLDRLAAQSANFTYAFVQAPVCVPSRASYFTGRYPHCHRNRVNYTPLDRSEVLMQARLKSAGYATASVGKLHYYPPTPEEARRTGFDFVELHDGVRFTDEWSDYAKWRQQNDPQAANFYYRSLAKDVKPGENPFRAAIDERFCETTWTGERTRHYLKQLAGQDKPFFLFCSFWKPHPSFEVPSALLGDVQRRGDSAARACDAWHRFSGCRRPCRR